MKNLIKSGLVGITLSAILAFSGCEAGLQSGNSSSGDSDETSFSFSDMYSKISAQQEEIKLLKETISLLQGVDGDSGTTITEMLKDIAALKETVGGASSGLVQKVNANTDITTDLNSLFANVTRDNSSGYDTIKFSGMNVQIINGFGATGFGTDSGVGNLIIGYNEARVSGNIRTGTHNLIIGVNNNYSAYGGMVVGYYNEINGAHSSITTGANNFARKDYSSVTGGYQNDADGNHVSISGGRGGHAYGEFSTITGGSNNIAGADGASVTGGFGN
ncbi:MAG: hypothetical protein GY754_42825, partial [bacterium]|nr:hypothetical protein [bacterium]